MLFPLLSPQPTVERPLKGPPRGLGGPFLFSRPLLSPGTSAVLPRPLLTSWTKSARRALFLRGSPGPAVRTPGFTLFSPFQIPTRPQSRRPLQNFRHFCTLEQGNRCARLALRPHIPRRRPLFRGSGGRRLSSRASQKRGAPARLSARPVSFGGARNPSSGGQDPVQASLENNMRFGNSPKIQSPFYGHIISSIKKLYRIKNRRDSFQSSRRKNRLKLFTPCRRSPARR